jgi:hypothetical protein
MPISPAARHTARAIFAKEDFIQESLNSSVFVLPDQSFAFLSDDLEHDK